MSSVRILICACFVLVFSAAGTNQAHERATSSAVQLTTQQPQIISTSATTEFNDQWTMSPASNGESAIDDPSNSATTSEENTDDKSANDICFRCYDQVKSTSEMVETYEALLKKQRKLISRKKAAAEASKVRDESSRVEAKAALSSSNSNGITNRHSSRSVAAQINGPNSTVRSRTLLGQQQEGGSQGEQIVVSRLRVARSALAPSPLPAETATVGQATGLGQLSLPSVYRPPSKDKSAASMTKNDLALERLKKVLERLEESTCKALWDLRYCLDSVSRECIGNLLFHTYELFADTKREKLLCPFPNSKRKPLPGLMRMMDLDTTKSPVPRRISSPEEVRRRMHILLGGGGSSGGSITRTRPLGVILEPTKQQSFNQQQLQEQQHQQQRQQLPTNSVGPYQGSMRDMSGHHFGRNVQQLDDTSLNMINVGKILLVPLCFAIMVALVALVSLHYNKPDEDEDEV